MLSKEQQENLWVNLDRAHIAWDEVRDSTECKPESQWACLQEWYVDWVKEKVRNNPLILDRHLYTK